MPSNTIKTEIVADAYLALLAERGIDYLFANGGTDFAPNGFPQHHFKSKVVCQKWWCSFFQKSRAYFWDNI